MASYATKVRFVKCPKCQNLLTEFAHIPVYKCGGCQTILQAKFYNANGGNASSGSLDTKQVHTLVDNESSNNLLIPSEKQTASCSLKNEVEHLVEQEILESSPTKAEQNFQGKDDSLEYTGHNDSMNLDVQGQADEVNETSPRSSLDEELEKPLKPTKQGSDGQSITSEKNMVDRAAVKDGFSGGSRSPSTRSYQNYDGNVSSSDDGYSNHVRNKNLSLSRRTFRHQRVLDSADDEEKGTVHVLATNVSTYSNQRVLHSSDVAGREEIGFLGENGMDNNAEEHLEVISRRTYRNQRDLHSANAKEKEPDNAIKSNDMSSGSKEKLLGDNIRGGNAMTSGLEEHLKEDMSSTSEGHLEGKSLSLNSPNEDHDSFIYANSESNGDELSSENRTHGQGWRRTSVDSEEFYSVQNWLESEKEGPSRSTSRGSTFLPDSLLYQDGISATKLKSVENERADLLRRVSELRNQLSGLYDQKMKHSAQFSSTSHMQPLMHQHYSGQQVCYMPQQCHFSRIPFSGQSYSSCLHCLPPQSCCHSGPCYSSSHSVSSHSSEIPYYHKVQRDDYELEKTHYRGKNPSAKRHCLPMSRGAPFVICSNCLELLQLPTDFLLSRKKPQKLQCGACSGLFVFPLHSKAYIDPLTPTEAIHLPSEADDNVDNPHGESISFSEDYELSFDNSCSTEIEPAQNVRNISHMQEAARPLHRLMGYSSARELLKTQLFEQPMQDAHQNRQDRHGRMGMATLSRRSADETSPNFMEKYEEDESPKKLKTRKVGVPLPGMVKRGVRELNHGLESLKIKVHVNRRTAPAP
ncbi:hypothetical protein J5N97_017437 [Dioscorea zingiberensis]|uniref:Zinc-ribbon domain-containing protein n=1 Tax=Dioscorea zingiberensis TaxID=325984 RepID=A0A9D5CLY0_9LILI|nr:hypothetical protein J5N97_017437 [Dioscorea zingiberensis]